MKSRITYPAHPAALPRQQSGFMLLEALIGILIFSLGILSLVALQSASVRMTGEAQVRATASMLTSKLFSEMWVSKKQPADLKTYYQTGGPGYAAWLTEVQSALTGRLADSTRNPTVVFDATSNIVEVRINWSTPTGNQWHSYTSSTVVGLNLPAATP